VWWPQARDWLPPLSLIDPGRSFFAFCMACEVGTRVPMAASRAASPAPDGDGEACRRGGHTLLLLGARLSVAGTLSQWHTRRLSLGIFGYGIFQSSCVSF